MSTIKLIKIVTGPAAISLVKDASNENSPRHNNRLVDILNGETVNGIDTTLTCSGEMIKSTLEEYSLRLLTHKYRGEYEYRWYTTHKPHTYLAMLLTK